MRKKGLEELTLIGHIEGNRNREKKQTTNLTRLCELITERGARVLAKGQTLLRATMAVMENHDCPRSEWTQHIEEEDMIQGPTLHKAGWLKNIFTSFPYCSLIGQGDGAFKSPHF